MVNHTKAFYEKQKQREIQEKLRLEEKRLLKESKHNRKLKRQREKYKAMKNTNDAEYQSYLEKQRIYAEKYRLKKNKDKEDKVIALLGERNWRKIKVEGKKGNYYVVDDGHIYKESGKEIGSVNSGGYVHSTLGYIHKIIWEVFKGKIPEGYEIDHINTVRNDNRLENLRLVTHKDNCNNSLSIDHYKQGNKTKGRNLSKYSTKYYDIVQMDLENNIIAKYKATKDIPSKYSRKMIYYAINGIYKTAYGCIWISKIKKN